MGEKRLSKWIVERLKREMMETVVSPNYECTIIPNTADLFNSLSLEAGKEKNGNVASFKCATGKDDLSGKSPPISGEELSREASTNGMRVKRGVSSNEIVTDEENLKPRCYSESIITTQEKLETRRSLNDDFDVTNRSPRWHSNFGNPTNEGPELLHKPIIGRDEEADNPSCKASNSSDAVNKELVSKSTSELNPQSRSSILLNLQSRVKNQGSAFAAVFGDKKQKVRSLSFK